MPSERIETAQGESLKMENLATAIREAAIMEKLVRILEIAGRKNPKAPSIKKAAEKLEVMGMASGGKDFRIEPYESEFYGEMEKDFSPQEVHAMELEARGITIAEQLTNLGLSKEEIGTVMDMIKEKRGIRSRE